MKKFLLFFLLLAFISSCKTFDFAKRRYNSGYYVDADGKRTVAASVHETPGAKEDGCVNTAENKSEGIVQTKTGFPTYSYESPGKNTNNQTVFAGNSTPAVSFYFSAPQQLICSFAQPKNSTRLELFSVLSFLIGLLAILGVAVYGILGAALLAILLGFFGRWRVRRHSERYKAKNLWAVGVAFGVIILVYILIVILTTSQTEIHIF